MMPFKPRVGDPIVWFHGGDREGTPFPGVVTRVDTGTQVTANLFTFESQQMIVRFGAKHLDDPTAKEHERLSNGGWDYPEWFKRVTKVVRELEPAPKPPEPVKAAAEPPKK